MIKILNYVKGYLCNICQFNEKYITYMLIANKKSKNKKLLVFE